MVAMTTRDNTKRCTRMLGVRTKFQKKGKLTPTKDAKIWFIEIKTLRGNIEFSMKKVAELVKTLTELRNQCVRTDDNLNNTLKRIKVGLKDQMEKSDRKVKDMEAKIAARGCDWWEAIFTLGIKCAMEDGVKNDLRKVKRRFSAQIKVTKSLQGKFDYFDGLKMIAKKLIAVAEAEKDNQKEFYSKMQTVSSQLKDDFTNEEIMDNLEDEDFLFPDFVEQFQDLINLLLTECTKVIKGCKSRAAELRAVVLGLEKNKW